MIKLTIFQGRGVIPHCFDQQAYYEVLESYFSSMHAHQEQSSFTAFLRCSTKSKKAKFNNKNSKARN